ncbi:hypothetical protein H112_04405 [Trichophyton rubrum D6]|uniref:Uncharacterized protein n=3 Tax=Trichophyton TaxID=5550 RepID=A0A080WL02_TRIRC|nr:uncharacterized protein TERG_12113 [Trichophyton rubrum CBS 118892]EZF22924.1 hypothetical protein H100_04414 [Trichophyton rubrum MR850]EZF41863.1 hypothetical protein H102_04398 [Trichophyton rubrum CBS 100081]EZF52536.1 hypothetical protein H103_04408 [Trichophyton rubrum CBS 288.86]EZF63025.1 hypothetical protein H104_04396 [Trichophyton rubrum CBS 289.86]EZF73776.1 hypothetical protein H105_04422 [Trichophyton soudanense CBS 452.61]EZF84414.1 hypothetical protein H110_04400 [Trichophy
MAATDVDIDYYLTHCGPSIKILYEHPEMDLFKDFLKGISVFNSDQFINRSLEAILKRTPQIKVMIISEYPADHVSGKRRQIDCDLFDCRDIVLEATVRP